jgi:hypothetical protein
LNGINSHVGRFRAGNGERSGDVINRAQLSPHRFGQFEIKSGVCSRKLGTCPTRPCCRPSIRPSNKRKGKSCIIALDPAVPSGALSCSEWSSKLLRNICPNRVAPSIKSYVINQHALYVRRNYPSRMHRPKDIPITSQKARFRTSTPPCVLIGSWKIALLTSISVLWSRILRRLWRVPG